MLLQQIQSINPWYAKRLATIMLLLIIVAYAAQLMIVHVSNNQSIASKPNLYANSIIDTISHNHYLEKKLVTHYLNSYLKCRELPKLIKRSQVSIQYVMQELEKRNLPKELALLPIIESSYKPKAISHTGASGIWQISRIAGKRYGLIYPHPKGIHDNRCDLIASTEAALSYLEFLYKRFDQDWLMALAAYNAGEGRISKAIKRNKLAGKDINYWDLTLPKETIHYIPKILALSIIFNNPQLYGLELQSI
jgi:membrane-bound lytic murein transglycosylase D